MTAGQPTKYRDEYVEEVVEFCALGYSLTGFAGHIGVDRASITNWGADHPEFFAACNRAKGARAYWWEQRARQVAEEGGPGGQATMVIFGLKNHAPEDYADVSRQEHTGKDGKDLIPAETDMGKVALVILTLLRMPPAGASDEATARVLPFRPL